MENADDKLAADIASSAFLHGCQQRFWELSKRDGDILYVRLFAPDQRVYTIRLDCASYGTEPIGGQFVDDHGIVVSAAWPCGNATFSQWIKFQESTLFICWDQDRNAIDNHHRDWRARSAWTKNPNQLVAYLDFLRQLLYLPSRGYEPRANTS